MSRTAAALALRPLLPVRAKGRLSTVVGLEAECRGLKGALGDVVAISVGTRRVPAQVVAVREDSLLLAPYGEWAGLASVYLLAAFQAGYIRPADAPFAA